MIIGFFLTILTGILSFFIQLLPVVDFPSQITTGVYFFWYYMNAASFLFPMSTLLTVLGIALTFHVTIFLWRGANWLGGYLRGK